MLARVQESDQRMSARLTAAERTTLASLIRKLRQPRDVAGSGVKTKQTSAERVAKLSA